MSARNTMTFRSFGRTLYSPCPSVSDHTSLAKRPFVVCVLLFPPLIWMTCSKLPSFFAYVIVAVANGTVRTNGFAPVAGSAGLVAKSWDAAHDQWGANQLQNRFVAMFQRRMSARDGQAWAAARMIGEAASRKHATDAKAMLDYFKSADFTLAAFKGQRLTLRDWNLQLRQPILLADGRVIVSVSPQEGFLHQVSELDTLGFDRPETKCRLK